MLIIRHKTGPLAGKEQRIEGRSGRVTFGRDPDGCDVVFPEDATIVGRRHFALVQKPSGQWTFDLFGDEYVAMNGEPVDADEAVHNGATVVLGRHDGPSFEVAIEREGLDDRLKVTAPQERVEGSHAVADRARKSATGARQYGLTGLGIALLAIGGAWLVWQKTSSDAAALAARINDTIRKQDEIAAQSITPALRDKLLKATYVVVKKPADGDPYATGTASPVTPDSLATNAHIVEIFEQLKKGEELWVRSPGIAGQNYKVVSAVKHPGYSAFEKFTSTDPFFVGLSRVSGGAVPDYDVGLLKVADGSNLGPVMEIASRDELNQLTAGFPLAMAGYPVEAVLGGEVQQLGATPTFSAGMITALTDMFMLPADASHTHLVHHNLPTAGGSSGSPMVGPNGKIVAFNNAGTSFSIQGQSGRIPSGVLINFAQRADLLLDLMEGNADAMVKADVPYWQQQTAAFKHGIDVIVPYYVQQATKSLAGAIPDNATPVLVSQDKFAMAEADRITKKVRVLDNSGAIVTVEVTQRQKVFTAKLKAGKPQVFIAYAENEAAIEMWLYSGSNDLRHNNAGGQYAVAVPFSSTSDMDIQIYVIGPDQDVQGSFFIYGWGAPPS